MSTQPPVTFAGYCSEAGTELMQEWFDGLPQEEQDELRDTMNYLFSMPITQWKRPEFDKVAPPLVEIRCKANKSNHEIRVYGVFDPNVRARLVVLNGTMSKKKTNDKDAQDLALRRWGLVKAGKAKTNEFSFEEKSIRESKAREKQQGKTGSVQSRKGYRLPDPGKPN